MARRCRTPKIKQVPRPHQHPRIADIISDDTAAVSWQFSLMDYQGPWGFDKVDREEFHRLITQDFKSKEGTTWAVLKTNGCHNVAIVQLNKTARKRLEELNLDDIDTLFSMRITGKKRIWGIRDGNIFKILWWDPEHEVCVSKKKHT